MGFRDDLQIGMARPLRDTDFGPGFFRLGFVCATHRVWNRTDGRKTEGLIPAVECACQPERERTRFEIAVPRRPLDGLKGGGDGRLILNVSFPLPDAGVNAPEPLHPPANTFACRVRYGNDSLIPVAFIELNLERKTK